MSFGSFTTSLDYVPACGLFFPVKFLDTLTLFFFSDSGFLMLYCPSCFPLNFSLWILPGHPSIQQPILSLFTPPSGTSAGMDFSVAGRNSLTYPAKGSSNKVFPRFVFCLLYSLACAHNLLIRSSPVSVPLGNVSPCI